jgi:hypothetical protein
MQKIKKRKASITDVKVYKCTDCGARTYLKDNGEITVGFCKKCGHPLWSPAEASVLINKAMTNKEPIYREILRRKT